VSFVTDWRGLVLATNNEYRSIVNSMLEAVFKEILQIVSWNKVPQVNERYVHTLKLDAGNFLNGPGNEKILTNALYTLKEFPLSDEPVDGELIVTKLISNLSVECTDTLFWLRYGVHEEDELSLGEIKTDGWTIHQTQWLGQRHELIFRARHPFFGKNF
jgi:hypothetical protein